MKTEKTAQGEFTWFSGTGGAVCLRGAWATLWAAVPGCQLSARLPCLVPRAPWLQGQVSTVKFWRGHVQGHVQRFHLLFWSGSTTVGKGHCEIACCTWISTLGITGNPIVCSKGTDRLGAGIWWQQVEAGDEECHWDTLQLPWQSLKMSILYTVHLQGDTTVKRSMTVAQAPLAPP